MKPKRERKSFGWLYGVLERGKLVQEYGLPCLYPNEPEIFKGQKLVEIELITRRLAKGRNCRSLRTKRGSDDSLE